MGAKTEIPGLVWKRHLECRTARRESLHVAVESIAFLACFQRGEHQATPTKEAEPLLQPAGYFVHRGVRLTLENL